MVTKAEGFARRFYSSQAWRKCAEAYKREAGGLCERCLKRGLYVAGVEVHHKTHLTPENLSNPAIALNWDNLELLCKDCHIEEHNPVRWRTDPAGHVIL